MALAPTAAADPAAPPADSMMMDDAGAAPEATSSKVLGTIMLNDDGSFQLVTGDEPEAAEPGETAEQAPSQRFDSAGPLLNAINDLLEGAAGAEGNPRQQAFNDGYGTAPNGTPTR